MRPPRVAVWRTDLLPPSETFIANQVAALSRWQPTLLGIRGVGTAGGPPPAGRWLPSQTGLSGRLEQRLMWAGGASPRFLRRLRAHDLVHAHFTVDAAVVLPAVRAVRRPLVVHCHGYDVTTSRELWTGRLARRWDGLVTTTSLFIAVSDFIAGVLIDDLGVPERKVRVHHIGIPVEPTAPLRSPGPPGVLFVGRLVEKKGLDDLIQALALTGLPVPLRVVGDGPLRGRATELAQRLGVDVTFLGAQPPRVVAQELSRASVFCVPSRRTRTGDAEGFGMVFLEAGAAGLPVVTYDSGGTSEAVLSDRTGLLAQEGDVGGLADRLRRVLGDPALAASLGAAGRARVVAEFDITRCTAALEDLYDLAAGYGEVGSR